MNFWNFIHVFIWEARITKYLLMIIICLLFSACLSTTINTHKTPLNDCCLVSTNIEHVLYTYIWWTMSKIHQLQELTNSPYVFLVPLLPSSEEGLIQVIGDKKLDKEIRFSVIILIFVYIIKKKKIVYLPPV